MEVNGAEVQRTNFYQRGNKPRSFSDHAQPLS